MDDREKYIKQSAFLACAELLLTEIDELSIRCLKSEASIKPCLRAALSVLESVRLSILALGGLDDNTAVDGIQFLELTSEPA